MIVQFCTVTAEPDDIDVNGNPSQYTHTIGTARSSVFRNGKRIDGTWSRAIADRRHDLDLGRPASRSLLAPGWRLGRAGADRHAGLTSS